MAQRQHTRGRGALSNPDNRYGSCTRESLEDGWWREEQATSPATELMPQTIRTIVSTNSSPDIPFDRSINPYHGCEHGCIYCYARPSHAYWDLSPGLDFETRIITKPGAADVLRDTLEKPRYFCRPINIGANTDPYQPVEGQLRTTREILEVLREFSHPFSLITKSALILRDLELLQEMGRRRLCTVAVSVTTLDNELKRRLEPRTASPRARLRVIETLAAAGVRVDLLVAPVIPAINDREIEAILAAGKAAGATAANYIFLRLPLEVSPLFREWLAEHYPERADHVMSLVQQSRGGRDNDAAFHRRMRARGPFAEVISRRFRVAARRLGLDRDDRFDLDTSQFSRPTPQFSLW